jgi:hypothetical protein
MGRSGAFLRSEKGTGAMGGFREQLKARRGLVKTQQLWEAALAEGERPNNPESVGSVFPPEFLKALRQAMEAGATCEQIVSLLMLAGSLREVQDEHGGDELIHRTCYITTVIKEDIKEAASALEWMRRVRRKKEENRKGERKKEPAAAMERRRHALT